MDINNIINNCNFCSVKMMSFAISDDKNIPYYCCKRSINNSSCSNNCNSCREIFARYVIINLLNENTLNTCEKEIFKSNDIFDKFQSKYLSNIFFYESEYVRYNIYLIFVCDNNIANKYDSFSVNMDYARKLFFTEEELKKYFCFFDDISSFGNLNKDNVNENVKESLNEIEKELKDMHFLLSDIKSNDKFEEYIFFNKKQMDDSANLEKSENEDLNSKKTNKEKSDYKVRTISELRLKHFRTNCFEENTKITFGKFNIIYGSNTAGKTSLLDAIEFGCTGKSRGVEKKDEVEIIWNNKVKLSSKNDISAYSIIKNTWYPNKMGSLNEIFRQINYFDIDATYRFALEQNQMDLAQQHINKLICDSKLIKIYQNLNSNRKLLEYYDIFFKKVFNIHKFKKNIKKRYQLFLSGFFANKLIKNSAYNRKCKNNLKKLIDQNNKTLEKVKDLINKQMSANIELINTIFSRLFSYKYRIKCEEGNFILVNLTNNQNNNIETMSTAQRVCLAMSVIFAKFFSTVESPRIILLDESVANFDSIHLLNFLDFLRDISINNIQIFFTTANDDVCKIAKSKFAFLNEEFYLHRISKNSEGKSKIESDKPNAI